MDNKDERKKCIKALDSETSNALFEQDQYLPNRLQDMHITDQRTRSDSVSSGISSASTSSSSSPSFTYLLDSIGGTSHGDNRHFYPYYPNDSHTSGHPPIASRSSSPESDNSVIGNTNGERRHVSTLTFQTEVVPSPISRHSSLSSDSSHNHSPAPDILRRQSGNIQEEAAYTEALISFQDDRMLKLKLDLESELRKLAKLRSQVNQMEKNMLENKRTTRSVNCSPSIEDVAKLREVNRRLQTDIQVMTREIDNYNNGLFSLGVCDPNALEQQKFFQNMNPGQRGSIFAPPPPDPTTSDSPPPPLPPRIHVIPPALRQQPPTGSGDLDGEGEQWSCSACTLLNHHAFNKCECCEMPRINSSPPSTGSFLQTPSFCDGININCLKHLDEKRCITNVQDKGSLFTTPLLCDGISVDCIADKRLDDRSFIKSVKDKDINCLLSNLNLQKSDEFTCLFSDWHFFKDKGILDSKSIEQLLKHAVCNGQSLMCRLVLTFFNDILKPNPFLTKILILALVNEKKECAKAISWFIVRAFYLQYKFAMIESPVEDIWPALRCMRSHRISRLPFLEDVVIVVELGNDRPNLPDEFCQLKIMFMTKDDSSSLELDNSPFQNRNEASFSHENVTVSGIDAKDLFTQHSKLTLICKSFITIFKKDSEHYFQLVPYVKLYCRAKGYIPIGEDRFPRKVRGMPTDILQGTPSLMANLKVGNTIGTDINKKGTLGGFVKVRGDICFLTCLHVFLSVEDLASDNISLDDDQWIKVKCYFPKSATNDQQINSYECGRIRDIAFEVDNERETSIDAALVTLNDGIQIDENDYLESRIGQSFPYCLLGMKSVYLNENSVDFKSLCYSIPPPTVEIVAVGAISGLISSKVLVNENDEKDIDLEPIDQTFSRVVLSEVKDKVTRVIRKLTGIHASNIISSDHIY